MRVPPERTALGDPPGERDNAAFLWFGLPAPGEGAGGANYKQDLLQGLAFTPKVPQNRAVTSPHPLGTQREEHSKTLRDLPLPTPHPDPGSTQEFFSDMKRALRFSLLVFSQPNIN